ncbi:RNA polymerase sigma factor [Herbiconiux daphne]|uniref:Sigma-70 family RNA polymerase sigma factor n=1 Tax=Herbiconiux daphne TaxID=2970914 RepID=A0ABT2GWF8_9MICO|nr:sigma-70 family RNA polymerase sigma factor [Herbiconiux daphne]MCS5732304.1 sigma-70 family RNA polymerase sigma factor [Herbiconiux daphne]
MEHEEESAELNLWARARAGDQPAFGSLFDLHKDRIFRHAFRLLADRSDAEDVLGTVFLELWRRRDDVRVSDGSILPWLLVTTTNTAMNLQRATRRYRHLLSRIPHEPPELSAEEKAFLRSSEIDPDLKNAIHSLNPTDQGLLTLVVIEDYTITDAAAVLCLRVSTARTRFSRLKAKLRANLNGISAHSFTVEGNRS